MYLSPLLLLSGAGLPAWVWDDVRTALPGAVVAAYPDDASLAQCADAVAAQAPPGRFAVVAHSLGGAVAAELVARHGDRVTGVLGVSAVVPRPGRSYASCLPAPAPLVLPLLLRLAGTRPPAGAVRRSLGTGLPSATIERLVEERGAPPRRLFVDRVSPGGPQVPVRGYLRTTRDREVPLAVQDRSAAELGAQWTQDAATGHLPMLEEPAAVVAAVERLLRG